MATDRWIRASDQDRDSAAELLSEAYAVGRLSREELDDRATAAYSAKTRGELHDLTADLPLPAARTALPSDTVGVPRGAGGRLARQLRGILLLVLAADLAVLVIPPAAWVAAILIPAVLLPLALGISKNAGLAPGTRPGMRRRQTRGTMTTNHANVAISADVAGSPLRSARRPRLERDLVTGSQWLAGSTGNTLSVVNLAAGTSREGQRETPMWRLAERGSACRRAF